MPIGKFSLKKLYIQYIIIYYYITKHNLVADTGAFLL